MNRDVAREHLAFVVAQVIDYLSHKGQRLPADLLAFRSEMSDSFADVRGSGPGRRAKEIQAVNTYQRKLESAYSSWADDLADDLADAEDDDAREEVLAAAVAALLLLLRRLGRENLPEAVALGTEGATTPISAWTILASELETNDGYLADALIPSIDAKVKSALQDPDIIAALVVGSGVAALRGILATMDGRVSQYANPFWSIYNQVHGLTADEEGKSVTWVKEPLAKHCRDCDEWGDRTYPSYSDMLAETGGLHPGSPALEDRGNCRCVLEFEE